MLNPSIPLNNCYPIQLTLTKKIESIPHLVSMIKDELKVKLDEDAKITAKVLIKSLEKKCGIELNSEYEFYWTNCELDMQTLTGIHGIRSSADITLKRDNEYYGISLKYSSESDKSSLRSPGIEDLTVMLNTNPNYIYKNVLDPYFAEVHRLVGKYVGTGTNEQKKAKYKDLIDIPEMDSTIETIQIITKGAFVAMATRYAKDFNKLTREKKLTFIKKMMDADKYPDNIHIFRAGISGKNREVSFICPSEEFDILDDNVEDYRAMYNGATFLIYSKTKDGLKNSYCNINIKNKSGTPFDNFIGRVSKPPKKKSATKKEQ